MITVPKTRDLVGREGLPRRRRTRLWLAVLAAASALPAQTWQPVPADELTLKDDPASPGADAIILYREVYNDDPKGIETRHVRIKILKDTGRKYANLEIPYVEKLVRIEDLQTRSVRPDGTSVELQAQVLEKVLAKARGLKIQVRTVTLPAVETGSIVEYSYRLRRKQGPPDVLIHPGNYVVDNALSFPGARWDIQQELFTRRARFCVKPLPAAMHWSSFGVKAERPARQPDGTVLLELKDIPAFREEELMPPPDLLKPHVRFFYTVGSISSAESFWRDWAKVQGEAVDRFIGNSGAIKREAARVVSPADTAEAKLRKLYARVQQLRYASYETSRTDKEEDREKLAENKNAEDVLQHGYGLGNDFNFLFVALARAAGLDAWIVAATARDEGMFRPNVPDPSQLNAMVVLVRLGSQNVYLDPATRFCPYGLLPWNKTGVGGIRLDKMSLEFVTTVSPASDNAVTDRKANLSLQADGSIQGKLLLSFSGQEALEWRLSSYLQDEAGKRQALEEEIKRRLPSGAIVAVAGGVNWDRSEEPLRVECDITIPRLALRTGRRLLLPAAVFQANGGYPLQHAQRVHAIYFRYPFQELDQLTLQIPAGLRVEGIPAPRKVVTDFAGFESGGQTGPGKIEIRRQFHMDGFAFSKADHANLRAFFDQLRANADEKVILQVEPGTTP